jgi:hypothetical protein
MEQLKADANKAVHAVSERHAAERFEAFVVARRLSPAVRAGLWRAVMLRSDACVKNVPHAVMETFCSSCVPDAALDAVPTLRRKLATILAYPDYRAFQSFWDTHLSHFFLFFWTAVDGDRHLDKGNGRRDVLVHPQPAQGRRKNKGVVTYSYTLLRWRGRRNCRALRTRFWQGTVRQNELHGSF